MIKKITILVLLIILSRLLYAQTTTSYDGKNNFLLNGKPFFPFGCYGIFWEDALIDKLNSVIEMGKAGLNIVCMEDIGETAAPGFTKVLDEAQKNKIQVLLGTPYAPNMKWRAIERKNHPATFGYTIADDADNGRFSLSELASINAEIKKEDPNHVTHLTLTGWNSARRGEAVNFIAISDFCSYQCYPICKHKNADFTTTNSLTETYKRTLAYVLEAEKANKPFVMLPQTFSWGSQSDSPCYPTVIELRNMIYLGLAAGVKGFISYDFSFDLVNNQKALWKEYSDLAKDIKSYHSILVENLLIRQPTGDEELVASSWQKGDSTLVVLINTSYTSSKNVILPLDNIGTQLSPGHSRLPDGMVLSGNILKGTLAPQETQAYWITDSPTGMGSEIKQSKLSLHPNPAKTELYINDHISENTTYEITSIEGKALQSGRVNGGSINIQNLQTGIYLIKLKTEGRERVQRFVKE